MERKDFRRVFVLGVVVLGMLVPPLAHAGGLPADPGTLAALDHALELWSQRDGFRAEGEAKRFLFYHPEHPSADEARRLLASIQQRMKGMGPPTADGPWGLTRLGPRPADSEGSGRAVAAMIRFYQNHLRTFRRPGGHCPMHPNCSEFALQAVRKHGTFLGAFIYVDRMWREFTEAGQPPLIQVGGRWKHPDPLEKNDWWLNSGKDGGRR
jgi:putative component of membrane protein insertase Oxa1/YidC/SpoIIIJ protein YidD